MLTIEADIYEYVRMSYIDKNILGPLVHMSSYGNHKLYRGYKVVRTSHEQTQTLASAVAPALIQYIRSCVSHRSKGIGRCSCHGP